MSGQGNQLAKDLAAVAKTLKVLVESQLGHEGRHISASASKKALEVAIMAGPVQRPFDDPNYGKVQWKIPTEMEPFVAQGKVLVDQVRREAMLRVNSPMPPPPPFTSNNSMNNSAPYQNRIDPGMTLEEEEALIREARRVGVEVLPKLDLGPNPSTKLDQIQYRPTLPKDYQVDLSQPSKNLAQSKERKVPTSRIARVANFGALAVGLGGGAAAEVTRRAFGLKNHAEQASSPFVTVANAERIVQTLCRVRGAALKLGQMLSLQDDTLVPQFWLDIFDRVRHSADFMPTAQVHKQLRAELGDHWRNLFKDFEDKPFAAASIGQVHRATAHDGTALAVKVQYPGVAEGIDADIDNLVSVLKVGGIFPRGMFLEEFVKVARRELKLECDYAREADCMHRMAHLLRHDPTFYVPRVLPDLSTKRVLSTEFVRGKPVDACLDEPQQVRDYIAAKFMELCLKEVFLFRFMQTDPNWSNFFFGHHPQTGEPRLILLDFGAARDYPKKFVDLYMSILQAAYNDDRARMLHFSRQIGFLTGFEDQVMERAHVDSIAILAETLVAKEPYDFGQQNVTERIHKLVPVMLEHRLTAPPEEIYSLHRKLSGAYLLATKLRAVVACGPIFQEIVDQYEFEPVHLAEKV